MSKEYSAAILGVKPEDIVEVETEEEFENLDGTTFKATVINHELSDNALVRNCAKFYANKIRRAGGDEDRIKKFEEQRDLRIAAIEARS